MLKNWNDVKPGDILTIHHPGQTRAHKMRVVTIEPSQSNPAEYAYLIGERLRMNGKPSSVPSGARKALPKGQRFEFVDRKAVKAVEPVAPEVTGDWTIAYRTPRANAFKRVTNWSGTWHQASEMAGIFGKANPDMQVWYTTSRAYEVQEAAKIAAGTLPPHYAEDHGNIMVDSGKRIRVRDNAVLSADMLALVPDADTAKARWDESYNAQPWVKQMKEREAA